MSCDYACAVGRYAFYAGSCISAGRWRELDRDSPAARRELAQSSNRNTGPEQGRLAISLFEFFERGKCRLRASAKRAPTTVSVIPLAASLKGSWEVEEAPRKSALLIQPKCQRARWTARTLCAAGRTVRRA